MPTNLLKKYNELLELLHSSLNESMVSLKRVFDRDFANDGELKYRGIKLYPTPAEGEDKMERLFRHLTTVITDEKIRKREFETERSVRLHWIKYHLEDRKAEKMVVFSVEDERRTYILDKQERYVIVLEPLKKQQGFYLLTAYRLQSSMFKKLMTKFEKRGKEGFI